MSQARCRKMLEELILIDSATANIAGVERIQASVMRALAQMGFRIRLLPNPSVKTQSADLLIAELAGKSQSYITMVTHADTVLSRDACGGFREDQESAFGSGAIDNKGGLTVLLEALFLYLNKLGHEKRVPDYSLRVVCSPNEEAGSLGFHEEFAKCSLDSALVLGFEPALDNGSIVESRRGNRWYQIHVKGAEAHAGRCHGEQINAAHELALKIVQLHELNSPSEGISVNIGHVQGGRDRFNVVCGDIEAKLDTRFASFTSRDKLHAEIDRILKTANLSSAVTGNSSVSTYEIVDDCPPFSNSQGTKVIGEFLLKSIGEIEGRVIAAEQAGGAGDVNYMSRSGVVVIDGLGPVGGFMHTPNEFVRLTTLSTRAQAVANLLENAHALLNAKSAS